MSDEELMALVVPGTAWLETEPSSEDTYDLQAETYDLEYRNFNQDLAFWLRIAHQGGGPILEIGAGTGRIAIPIAQAGFNIIGVDKSSKMLDHARRKTSECTLPPGVAMGWIHSDIRQLQLPDRHFATTIVPFGVLNYMTGLRDQLRAVAEVRRVTRPGGLAVVDIAHFPLSSRIMQGNTSLMVQDIVALQDSQVVTYGQSRLTPGWNTSDYTEVVDVVMSSGEVRRHIYRHRWHLFTLLESCYLFLLHGFRIEAIYGDYDGRPFGVDSRHIILQMTKAG